MKRAMYALLPAFLLCQSCIVVSNSEDGKISGTKVVKGEGSIVEVKPECSGFTALDLCAPLEAVVETGGAYSVSIKGYENLVNLLETEVEGNALAIRLKEQCIFKQRVELRVTMPVPVQRLSLGSNCALSLQQDVDARSFDVGLSGAASLKFGGPVAAEKAELSLSGASRLEGGSRFAVRDASLSLSGACNLSLSAVEAGSVSVDASGACDFKLSGTADALSVEVSGAGDGDCRDLKARSAECRLSGAADCSVYASERLKARASGASDVAYYGGPAHTEIHTSGASSVDAR